MKEKDFYQDPQFFFPNKGNEKEKNQIENPQKTKATNFPSNERNIKKKIKY